MKIFQKIKNEKCSGLSEDIRFVLKRRRRKRKHNVPVSNKQEVRKTRIKDYVISIVVASLASVVVTILFRLAVGLL